MGGFNSKYARGSDLKKLTSLLPVALMVAAIGLAVATAIRESLSPLNCVPINFNSTNPFTIEGSVSGDLTRYVLRLTPGEHVAYLLIAEMEPAFRGLTLPALIRSDDPMVYSTDPAKGTGMSARTQSAYTILSEEKTKLGRFELRFPVEAHKLTITQADGRTLGGRLTHLQNLGLEHAVDISGKFGSLIVAAKAGVVVYAENRSPDGACSREGLRNRPDNQIVVLHNDGTEAVYGHLRQGSLRVRVGQRVTEGDPLAEMGSSGWTPGTHLHFHLGGLTPSRYRTLPLVFLCSDGTRITPAPGGKVCAPRS